MDSHPNSLDEARALIDATDAEILAAFTRRMEIVKQIAEIKRNLSIPILNSAREEALIAKIRNSASPDLADYAEELFRTLISLSKKLQSDRSDKSDKSDRSDKIFGLSGEKLGHSYSPQIHHAFGKYNYVLHEEPKESIKEFILHSEWSGWNVTMPYKKLAFDLCEELSPQARRIGAVNVIIRKDGKIKGYNTDYDGFLLTAEKLGIDWQSEHLLILGTGGAASMVRAAAEDRNVPTIVNVSRSGPVDYSNVYSLCPDTTLLVNATPVGMFPGNESRPVDLSRFPKLRGVIDLIYNPSRTNLILQAEKLGIPAIGGLAMLVEQARLSAELFTESVIPPETTAEITDKISRQCQNITIIGMPGSGKSTLARKISQVSGRPLFDTDELIVQRQNMSIPEIFAKFGEEKFRDMEAEIIKEVCRNSGAVIATGGGAILREENRDAIRQNSHVIWLKRPLNQLARDGRPLSADFQALVQLFEQRAPIYQALADEIIDN